MTAARGAAFAAAVRMVYRVHGDAAVMRLASEPATATGLADRNIHMIRVRHRTDGPGAAAMDQTLFARVQTNDHVVMVAADELRIGTGGTRELAALADLQFHIVDDGADRHVAERDHSVADRQTLRGQDISLGAVGIFQQRDEGGAVRIVFETLDGRRHIDLGALEIDDAIGLLVATALEV